MAVVYLHKRKDNNEVFYIGIGNDIKRALSTAEENFKRALGRLKSHGLI